MQTIQPLSSINELELIFCHYHVNLPTVSRRDGYFPVLFLIEVMPLSLEHGGSPSRRGCITETLLQQNMDVQFLRRGFRCEVLCPCFAMTIAVACDAYACYSGLVRVAVPRVQHSK